MTILKTHVDNTWGKEMLCDVFIVLCNAVTVLWAVA
jgi:hypothetical protein